MKNVGIFIIIGSLLASCTLFQPKEPITQSPQYSSITNVNLDEKSYEAQENLTQTGLFQELGEVIIKDPIMGRSIYQTIDGNIISTIAHRNELRSLDYRNSGLGKKNNIVYPALIGLSLAEQAKLLEPIINSNPKEIEIDFASTGTIDVRAFKTSFQQLPKAPVIQIEFYGIPANYYELFDVMDERLTKNSEVSIRIWLPDLPYGFSVDSFLLHTKAWINHHPDNLIIKSFSFSILNAPGMQFILKDKPLIILGDFPAKSISVSPLGINTKGEPPGDGPKGKAIIEQFFKNSKVENMNFDFGKKEGNKIEIYGY